MSRVFTARLDIDGNAGTLDPAVFELYAKVVDLSLAGYSVFEVSVSDLVYDENLMTGDHNRWAVTEIIARGTGAYPGAEWNSLKALVTWDDVGTVDPGGPAAGSGAICSASPKGLTESPNTSMHGISEALSVRLRNIDNRYVIDPQLGTGGSGTTTDSQVKEMQNGHTSTIAAGKPIAKRSDGFIIPADSDGINGAQRFIGVTLVSIAPNALGNIMLIGPNVANAVVGKSFIPGEDVYLHQDPALGYTNNITDLTGDNDSIIRVGYADCAAGAASGTSTDLILFTEVISQI